MRCPSFGHFDAKKTGVRLVDLLLKIWHHAKGNPKSSLAGLAALAACFLPEKLGGMVVGVAAGVGLILSADA